MLVWVAVRYQPSFCRAKDPPFYCVSYILLRSVHSGGGEGEHQHVIIIIYYAQSDDLVEIAHLRKMLVMHVSEGNGILTPPVMYSYAGSFCMVSVM